MSDLIPELINLLSPQSDFEFQSDRYDRETRVMRTKRLKRSELIATVDLAMSAALCKIPSDIMLE
jgi:hypothetical protein